MFKFTPVSEEEIAKSNLLEKGEYTFYVKQAEYKTSRAGNPMIELILSVHDHNNKEHIIYDYLMDGESLQYKIRHFCYSIGIGDKYELGGFNIEDCVNKNGAAKVYIREDKTGQYKPKNAISDYMLKSESTKPIKVNTPTDDFFDDKDIPF